MRLRFPVALLAGVALCSLQAAPPRKAAPKRDPAAKAPADIPAAGAGGELLDLGSGRSRAIGAMLESRTDCQATAFPDGRVLVTGGSQQGGSTEWFDPATRRFSSGPAMAQARQGHGALLLKDGRLLVAGGTENPAPAEILDPATWKFQPLPGDARFGLSAELLETEGGILLIDGQTGKCWLWDGKAKGPKSTGSLANARILFKALRLQDGRVLVTGGWPAPQLERRGGRRTPPKPTSALLAAEAFNPHKGRWSSWKASLQPRARHQAALLPDGRVALFGGFGASADVSQESLEILDPAKESVTVTGKLAGAGQTAPGWVPAGEGGLYLPERATSPRKIAAPEDLMAAGPEAWHLANAYQAPVLVPLQGSRLLVLGSAVWGSALERWDPRIRQCQYLGALRAGTESLALVGGRVLALGPIVDAVDPKTGGLTVLGRREELTAQLKKVSSPAAAPLGNPPFPEGQALKDYLVLPLDAKKALVLGGRSEECPEGTERVWVWEPKKKSLSPSGSMRTKRAFPAGSREHGALKLPDGAVLIW